MSNDIASRAMLVYLNTSMWSARKLDRGATAEVTKNHDASADSGRFNKQLLPKESLAPITQIASAARAYLYANTRAWGDNGERVMSSDNYLTVMPALAKFRADFTAAVDAFCDEYTTYRERARLRLNTLFDDNDYPPEWDVRDKFRMSFGVMPLPTAGDFRCALPDDAKDDVRAEIDARVKSAMDDVWDEVKTRLTTLRTRLEETQGGAGRMHESLLTNIEDLVARLPGLNLTGDKALDDVHKLLAATFNGMDMKDIKKSDALRTDVMRQTDDILKQMGLGL